MIEKIVFLRYLPLTKKIKEDFFMEEMFSCGFKVEYWDITSIFFCKTSFQVEEYEDRIIERINNIKDFEVKVKSQNNKQVLYIPIMTTEGRVYKLYKIFSKYNCRVGIFGRNMIPVQYRPRKIFSSYLRKLKFSNILNKFYSKLLINLFQNKFNGFEVIFQAGKEGYKGIGEVRNQKSLPRIVKINSDDYDRGLSLQQENPCGPDTEENYAVFLDEYYPFHPDSVLLGSNKLDYKVYYKSLNNYFDIIEQYFKIKVVIAAHPKAIKYRTLNYFDGREIYFNKTQDLVQKSYFVITHDSTSINYAIIFRKPIVLLSSHEINRVFPNNQIKTFSSYLGIPIINLDDISKNEIIEKNLLIQNIRLESYEKWKYDFLTWTTTQDKQSKDIVIQYLKKDGL